MNENSILKLMIDKLPSEQGLIEESIRERWAIDSPWFNAIERVGRAIQQQTFDF